MLRTSRPFVRSGELESIDPSQLVRTDRIGVSSMSTAWSRDVSDILDTQRRIIAVLEIFDSLNHRSRPRVVPSPTMQTCRIEVSLAEAPGDLRGTC